LWTVSRPSVRVAVTMWFVPATQINSSWNEWWTGVSKPWHEFETTVSTFLPQSLPGNLSTGGYSSFGDSFRMSGALNLSDSIAMTAKSKEPLYWRAKTYDEYDGKSWKNTEPTTLHVLPDS